MSSSYDDDNHVCNDEDDGVETVVRRKMKFDMLPSFAFFVLMKSSLQLHLPPHIYRNKQVFWQLQLDIV